jgi:hypothetical protein
MDRLHLLPGQTEIVQQPQHAVLRYSGRRSAPAQAFGLTDPRLVLEPDLEPLSFGMVTRDLSDQRCEFS